MKNKQILPIIKLNSQLTPSQVWDGGCSFNKTMYFQKSSPRETTILALWKRETKPQK